MFNRLIGIFKLDKTVFDEIEHDPHATLQAAAVVATVSLLSSLGSGVYASIRSHSFFTGFLVTLVWYFFGWVLWALISHFVGTAIFGGKGSLKGMLRLVGFAYLPQALGVIACFGGIAGWVWSLLAGFVAVRQGLELDNLKAALTIAIGFIPFIIGYGFFYLILLPR
jgi:hypothetical protein